MTLQALGWNAFTEQAWQAKFSSANLTPGRVFGTHRGFYTVWTADGAFEAPARGKLIRDPETRPVTGDWVAFEPNPPTVRDVLPRRTQIVRKAPGEETVS